MKNYDKKAIVIATIIVVGGTGLVALTVKNNPPEAYPECKTGYVQEFGEERCQARNEADWDRQSQYEAGQRR